ncbi:APC family permease [Streptomyces sp. NPDC057486]|uniref:APC family permease n=1 Tax=Streptomyces sp. NPDC057486 TaxID=3346145 RepID=UPI0036B150A8
MSTEQTASPQRPGERTGDMGAGQKLQGRLGTASIVFMVLAAAAPLTIFLASPVNLLISNGPGIVFDYLAGAVIMMVFAAGYAVMTVHVKKAGAFYSYISAALGRRVGVGAGFLAAGSYFAMQSGIYAYFGYSLNGLVVQFFGKSAPNMPWWCWGLVALAAVSWLGYHNIDLSARVLGVALLLEVLVIVILDATILIRGGGDEGISATSVFTHDAITSGSLSLGILFGLSVSLGFEATAVFRDEARDPSRTIPRAVYITVAISGTFYALAMWAYIQAYGADGIVGAVSTDPGGIVYATTTEYVGQVLTDVMRVLAVTSMVACTLSYHNILARYLHSLGSSVLPQGLTRVHPRYASPHTASLVTSGVALLMLIGWTLTGFDPVSQILPWQIAVGTACFVILLIGTSVSIIVFFRRNPELERRRWPVLVSPVLSIVLNVVLLVLVTRSFSTLSGTSSAVVNWSLKAAPLVLVAAGVITATCVKKLRPERYAALDDHGTADGAQQPGAPSEDGPAASHPGLVS